MAVRHIRHQQAFGTHHWQDVCRAIGGLAGTVPRPEPSLGTQETEGRGAIMSSREVPPTGPRPTASVDGAGGGCPSAGCRRQWAGDRVVRWEAWKSFIRGFESRPALHLSTRRCYHVSARCLRCRSVASPCCPSSFPFRLAPFHAAPVPAAVSVHRFAGSFSWASPLRPVRP